MAAGYSRRFRLLRASLAAGRCSRTGFASSTGPRGGPWADVYRGSLSYRMPALAPSKIVCVGRNYAAHAKELGNDVPKEPLLFLKPPSSLIRSEESIVLPTVSNRVEYEGEIGVVVGQRLRKVSPEV